MEAIIFPKIITSKGKRYLYLMESYRDKKGVPTHRTKAALGCIDDFFKQKKYKKLLKAMSTLADEDNKLYDMDTAEEKDRIFWGAYAVIKKLWDLMNLDNILLDVTRNSKLQFNFFEAIFLMLVDRFTFPCSKYQTFLNQDKYHQPDKVEIHQFYRALDILAKHKEKIESALFKRSKKNFNISVNIVFYDTTTLYFESVRPNSLKDFGFSKDHKFGEVQVMVGLIVDLEGMPIGFEVFPGNLYEGDTLKAALERLKRNFGVQKLIFIADQGMLSNDNLKYIRSYGYEYIIGARIRSKPVKIKEDILDLTTYENVETKTEKDILKIKSLSGIDEEDILKIKDILNQSALTTVHLKEIRNICKSMTNTILRGDVLKYLKEHITDTVMIKKICESRKKGSAIQKRIEKVRDSEIKNDLLSYNGDLNNIIGRCQAAQKKSVPELISILNAALEEKIILTWSFKRKEKNQKDRERLYKKAEEAIKNNRPIMNKQGYRKYININNTKPTLNPYKKVEEEQWDGFFGLQTNIQHLSSAEISGYYHQLWKIEQSFRILKSHLEMRPIYHYSPSRIKGHLMLCFIALLLERTLELKLSENGIDFSAERIRTAVQSLQASKIEVDGEILYLRSTVSELSKNILKMLKIKIPANISHETVFLYNM